MTANTTDKTKYLDNSHEGHIDRGRKQYQLPKGNTGDVRRFLIA